MAVSVKYLQPFSYFQAMATDNKNLPIALLVKPIMLF